MAVEALVNLAVSNDANLNEIRKADGIAPVRNFVQNNYDLIKNKFEAINKTIVNKTIVIDGLTKSTHLNGKQAIVMKRIYFHQDRSIEAYLVKVLKTGEKKKLHRQNMIEPAAFRLQYQMQRIQHVMKRFVQ